MHKNAILFLQKIKIFASLGIKSLPLSLSAIWMHTKAEHLRRNAQILKTLLTRNPLGIAGQGKDNTQLLKFAQTGREL